jgi:hypothetical protein
MGEKTEKTLYYWKDNMAIKGEIIYKSTVEYWDEHMGFFGEPYYRITEIDGEYYLWEFDPEKRDYRLLKKSKDFEPLHQEAVELAFKVADELKKKYGIW